MRWWQPFWRTGLVYGKIRWNVFPHHQERRRQCFGAQAMSATGHIEDSVVVGAKDCCCLMRPSTFGSRGSQAAVSAAASAKLLEKRKEYEAVAALAQASQLYLERIEGLADDCDIMANAGEGVLNCSLLFPSMFDPQPSPRGCSRTVAENVQYPQFISCVSFLIRVP